MKNFMLLVAGIGVAVFLVNSQTTPANSESTIMNTKERIWLASEANRT